MKRKAKDPWQKEWNKQLKLWFSDDGTEFQLNLVSQGYEDVLWSRLLPLFGSGFSVMAVIKRLRREINNEN